MTEWKEYKLGEIADVRDGTHDSPKESNNGFPLVTSKNIKNGKIDLSNTYLISKSDYEFVNQRSKVDKWDILFSMIGTIGECAIVKQQPEYAIKNVGLFKTHGDELLAYWIYYYIHSQQAKSEMRACIKGSTQQYISLTDLRNFPIELPIKEKQLEIVSILSSLDDKIDLLHRENRTLEAMAETLFRQWFIEEAKEDWKEKELREIVDISIGRTPPRKETKWFSTNPSDVKWLSIKDMGAGDVFLFNTSEYLTKEAVETFSIPIIPKNTVVLSFKMTVGRVGITTEDMLSNEAIAHFKFTNKTPITTEYLYLFLKSFKYDSLGSTSSIVTAINSAMIKQMQIIIPDEVIMKKFEEQTQYIFDKIFSNQKQIQTLIQTRDGLLPRLMNNEIKL